jgi:tetratricopeptide (TPR) repeat protein
VRFLLESAGKSLGALALVAAAASGCADARVQPTFPELAVNYPSIVEQALLGLNARGDALVAQLIAVEGTQPKLELLLFDRDAGPTRTVSTAPIEIANSVAARILREGNRAQALLGAAVEALWKDGVVQASQDGFSRAPPMAPEPGLPRWAVLGAGGLPFSLRIADTASGPGAALLMLSEEPIRSHDTDEVELSRMPIAGVPIAPLLWVAGSTAWMLAGSVSVSHGEPLHRAVGLRRGSISRGEATLHNQHGLADYAAGELDAARRELERALRADPRFVDALYNAASVAALTDRADEAVALLRRAAEEDPRRVQVLGRDDEDLKTLRRRPDVRQILGLARMPPGE